MSFTAFSRTALVRNIIFSFTNADDAKFWCDLVCVQCLYFLRISSFKEAVTSFPDNNLAIGTSI